MYYMAIDTLATAGYRHYEISNFARPGYECRHNLKYWRDEEYVGLGPGAASRWRGRRYRNATTLAAYAAAAAATRWPLGAPEQSDAAREMRTAFVLGLRLLAGVDTDAFRKKYRVNVWEYFEPALSELIAAGLLEAGNGVVRLSRRGLFLADEAFSRLI